MSRLRRYIGEAYRGQVVTSEQEEALAAIRKDCGYYLRLLGGMMEWEGARIPFRRAMVEYSNRQLLMRKDARQDRKPRGSDWNTFKKMNEWLVENGHVRRDKAVRAINDKPEFAGEDFFIWPIGRFDYTWVASNDFNFKGVSGYVGMYDKDMVSVKEEGGFDKLLGPYLTTNKGIGAAHKKGYEIWFGCRRFYYASVRGDLGRLIRS